MCRKESWGAITVPKEAHSTQRGQPPRYRQMQGIFLFIKRFLKHQNFLSDSSNSYLMWTFVTRLPQQAIQRHSLCVTDLRKGTSLSIKDMQGGSILLWTAGGRSFHSEGPTTAKTVAGIKKFTISVRRGRRAACT